MDGGSTDETASVAKDYGSRLTFISEKDRGQSHAINKGFQMAHGTILAWLNSDDLYLPGTVRKAVTAFKQTPAAGAIYGEGYLIDREGNTTSRFPCTEPFNLWKLVHLSDYILQQTVYFRKDVLDQVGYLDEDLHYTMDWDILVRIGMRYPLMYIPEYMGCLREYPEAKSFAGGIRRANEIRGLLQRHTGRRISPGYVVYGLETYQKVWCDQIGRACGPMKPVANKLQSAVRLAAGTVIGRTIRHSQGVYSDGWAGRVMHYMLPPGGDTFALEGSLPQWPRFAGQTLRIEANGRWIADLEVPYGDFQLHVEIPPELRGQLLRLTIRASKSFMPGRFTIRGDRRRLAYLLKAIRWVETSDLTESLVQRAQVGI